MRKTIISVHKWVGLGVFLLLFVQAGTGLMLTYKTHLWGAFHGEVSAIETSVELDLEGVVSSLNREFRSQSVERIVFDKNRPNFLTARVYDREKRLTIVLIDGGRGQVVKKGRVWNFPVEIAERVHVSLMAGEAGYWILMFEGLVLVALSITGLIIWWPKKNLFSSVRIRFRAPLPLLLRDLHSVPALLVSPFLVLIGLSGTALIAESSVRPIVSVFAEVSPEPELKLPDVELPSGPASITDAVNSFHERFPEGQIRQLRYLANDRLIAAIMTDHTVPNPRAHHIAALDTWSSELIIFADAHNRTSGDEFLEWILPVHTGEAWAALRYVVQSLIALILIVTCISGPLLWFIKHKRRKKT